MDVRRVLDSTEPYTLAKEHMTGLLFGLMMAVVVVIFALIVIVDAIEVQQAKATRSAMETTVVK